jgi:Capsule polysaccharide biosynthesis protein
VNIGTPVRRAFGARVTSGLTAYARSLATRTDPRAMLQARRRRRQRAIVESMLATFAATRPSRSSETVLIDGTWDNPNYWVRESLLRAALGLRGGRETGLIGPYRRRECAATFGRLGIYDVLTFDPWGDDRRSAGDEARRWLKGIRGPDDIMQWRLPHDFPPAFLYDGILKRQRAACVDVRDSRLIDFVGEFFGTLRMAEQVLASRPFSLVVLSHVVNYQYAALAWLALRRGIPVVVLYGEFGLLRLVKLTAPAHLTDAANRPSRAEFDALTPARAEGLATAGRSYLERRLAGGTEELGAIMAYHTRTVRTSRAAICDRFRWDPSLPIVAVYASNWFDLPHTFGMASFRDFLDWLEATLAACTGNSRVNWLFKAHPCDAWYGGVTLADLMPREPAPNVRLVPDDWHGAALLEAVDGLVTYHGTAGIECAALGKPVLLADRGWYHDLGIARWPRSRDDYLQALATDWWKDLDLADTTRRAQIFAGWHFGRPRWQDPFVLEDDPIQDPIYERLPTLWGAAEVAIAREVDTISSWFASGHRHYHTFKMSLADDYAG